MKYESISLPKIQNWRICPAKLPKSLWQVEILPHPRGHMWGFQTSTLLQVLPHTPRAQDANFASKQTSPLSLDYGFHRTQTKPAS